MENKIKFLPNEVQHKIIGYSYGFQSKELLRDIRSFHVDLEIVIDCYFIHYNINILFFDICEFCNKIKKTTFYFHKLACKKQIDLEHFCYSLFKSGKVLTPSCYGKKETYSKIRNIWGVLSPELRTRFINEYILLDELIL